MARNVNWWVQTPSQATVEGDLPRRLPAPDTGDVRAPWPRLQTRPQQAQPGLALGPPPGSASSWAAVLLSE